VFIYIEDNNLDGRYPENRDMRLNQADYRRRAKRMLPGFVFDYVDSGAEDEWTLQRNRAVFHQWQFVPSVLKDSTVRDLSLKLFGTRYAAPVLVAPTGYNGMLRYRGDCQLARAAAQAGIGYIQSTVSTDSIEEIAALGVSDHHWFQLYVLKERQVTVDLLRRAKKAGCKTLVISVDAVHFGNRERDKRHYRKAMHLSWQSYLHAATKPGWVWRVIRPQGIPEFGNLTPYLPEEYLSGVGGAAYFAEQMETHLDWSLLAWVRSLWDGPILIKGILSPADAKTAMASGFQGVVLSNHGGRQLDGSVSPLAMLPAVREAVGPGSTVLIDSGFRRGTDIVKAIALGADAVLLGRPLLYALACRGLPGVSHVLTAIIEELDRTMAQLGCCQLSELSPALLYHQGQPLDHQAHQIEAR
jgi:(S)-mandelate dehydrogenase